MPKKIFTKNITVAINFLNLINDVLQEKSVYLYFNTFKVFNVIRIQITSVTLLYFLIFLVSNCTVNF